jgi:hypothetical protein
LFTESEFHSVWTVAQELGIYFSTVYDRLVNVVEFSLRNAQWAPHLITEEIKAERVTTSREMLLSLQNQKLMNFT